MNIFKKMLFIGAASLFVPAAMAQEGAGSGEVQRFQDWGRQCETTPAGDQLCFIFQNVDKKDTKQRMMSVRVFYPKDKKQPAMVVTVPLGTLLPAGAAMVIDGSEPVQMAYLACAQEGCATAPTLLSDELVSAMKKGTQGSVRVAALNKKVIGLPVSLSGFTKALNSITP